MRTQIDIRSKKMNNSFPKVRTSETLCPHICWKQERPCIKNVSKEIIGVSYLKN